MSDIHDGFKFDDERKKKFFQCYFQIVTDALSKFGDNFEFEIDRDALSAAFLDIQHDLIALSYRRLKKAEDGISAGKLAGVLAFRLAKMPIVHIHNPANMSGDAKNINAIIAIGYAANMIGISTLDIPPQIRFEILYQLLRRHANQETIGVIFDTIRYYHGDQKHQKPEDSVASVQV